MSGVIADISKWQGNVDWSAASRNLDFVILRASCGTSVDTKFYDNVAGCKRYGIPFHAYHYLKAADSYEAEREAETFAEAMRGITPLFYVIDCEYSQITLREKKEPGTANRIVNDFADCLRQLIGGNIRIAVYIGHHLYSLWRLDYDKFAYVWIPRYGKNSGSPETKPSYSCDLWQYTSNGKLDGVSGRVDLNQLMGTKPLSFFTTAAVVPTVPAVSEPEQTPERSESTMFTGKQMAEFALAVKAAGWVYWYGTCGYKCSTSLYNSKKKQYPSMYTDARESGYKADIAAGRMCADCVGIIKAFFWLGGSLTGSNKYGSNGCPDKSATGMYKLCKETGPISDIPDIPGLVVWKEGHIGIYVGGGYTVEMQSFANDCVYRKVTSGSWTNWGKLPSTMLTYDDSGESTTPTVYKLGDRTLSKGDEGQDVSELQSALVALGYSLGTYGANKDGVDGDFGSKTQNAVMALQAKHGLASTGIFGASAYKVLLEDQAGGDGEVETPEPDTTEPTTPTEPDTPENGGKPAFVLILEGDEQVLRLVQSAYGGTLAEVDSVSVG